MAACKSVLWLEIMVLALAAGFWLAGAPATRGRELAPADLLENALPAKMTIENADKRHLLSAVCDAVRKQRKSGPGITMAAAAARGEWAGDIVGSVLRCAKKVDCEYAGAIVRAAVTVRPGAATAISDAAIARAPRCEETIAAAVHAGQKDEERARSDSPSPSPQISPGTEEEFDPLEKLDVVCDDGAQRAVRASQLADFLRAHPGAMEGPCPPTPSPTPISSPGPSL